jgi:hypothetical protein
VILFKELIYGLLDDSMHTVQEFWRRHTLEKCVCSLQQIIWFPFYVGESEVYKLNWDLSKREKYNISKLGEMLFSSFYP